MTGHVLLVEDDRLKRLTLVKELSDAGYGVTACENAFQALKEMEHADPLAVVTDLRLPGMDGLSLLKEIKRTRPRVDVIVVTAYGSVDSAVEAIKAGAFDYVLKPFSAEELVLKLRHVVDRRRLLGEIENLRSAVSRKYEWGGMISESKEMRDVFERAQLAAPSDVTILIQGETGVGKEMLAKAIHFGSPRASAPFMAFCCAALNPNLIESELFGHEAGAFTGAARQKRGRFELAGEGTVFLDDIDDLPLDLQVKLLRVLQERCFERVGGEHSLPMRARVICATKRDLRELSAQGKFRDDLLYRIDVVRLTLPPLRERKSDIGRLFGHLWSRSNGSGACSIDPEAMKILMAHDWPGNVRELENVVQHAKTFAGSGAVTLGTLPPYLAGSTAKDAVWRLNLQDCGGLDLPELVREIENECIRWAMVKAGGNESRASELLGLPRTTLRRRLTPGSGSEAEPSTT